MKKTIFLLLMAWVVSLASSADVTINNSTFPDVNFRNYMFSEYPSGVITTVQLNARTALNMEGMGIANAKGIELFPNLTRLDLYNNNLTSVIVMYNTKLTYINVAYNQMAWIDVSANTKLEELYLQNNELTDVSVYGLPNLRTLWVHNNPTMTALNCYRNNLTNFNVRGCTALQKLKCFENPNLTYITGLETCTAITYLDCEDCAISSLSGVSGMNKLEYLYCRNNDLATLDVSNKSKLVYLRVQGNAYLTDLNCHDCNLTTLNIYSCPSLERIYCYYNLSLQTITGLADCTALRLLSCGDCALTTLSGVAGKTQLTDLYCYNNDLASLDVTGCTNLKYLYIFQNHITGSNMTALVNSLPSRGENGYLEAIYDEDEGNTINDAQLTEAIRKNWRVLYHNVNRWTDIRTLDYALNAMALNIHFTSDGDYPWFTIEDGDRVYAQSGNAGVSSSTSTLTATVNVTVPGTMLYFDYKAWGEGSSTAWDKCIFSVDGTEIFCHGALQNDWYANGTQLTVGQHTLTWTYSKDSSVHPMGDYFAVDNVYLHLPDYIMGDVDNDNSVSIADVSALIDYLLTGDESGINYQAADCDQSGDVGISDVSALIDYLLSGHW